MVVFNQQQMHDLDSNHWVDFSNQCDKNSRITTAFANATADEKSYKQNVNDETMIPPQLSLSLDHYCVIAENVFISFLKSYRSLYSTKAEAESAIKAVNEVIVLGIRLEAFLTVVLPFHKEYGTVHRKVETCRIHDMTFQLRDTIPNV